MGYVILWILLGVLSAIVATNKGRSGCAWFVIGALLGPLGFLIALVLPKDDAQVERDAIGNGVMKKCPYCAELVKKEAIICRYCNKEFTAPITEEAICDGVVIKSGDFSIYCMQGWFSAIPAIFCGVCTSHYFATPLPFSHV